MFYCRDVFNRIVRCFLSEHRTSDVNANNCANANIAAIEKNNDEANTNNTDEDANTSGSDNGGSNGANNCAGDAVSNVGGDIDINRSNNEANEEGHHLLEMATMATELSCSVGESSGQINNGARGNAESLLENLDLNMILSFTVSNILKNA